MMIKWLYGYSLKEIAEYQPRTNAASSEENFAGDDKVRLEHMVKLWELGDKYSLDGLRLPIELNFRRVLAKRVLSDLCDTEAWVAIETVYVSETNIDVLRLVIQDVLTKPNTIKKLKANRAMLDCFRNELSKIPTLVLDVAMKQFQ